MTVRTAVDGPVLIVTIDRPQARNAVDRDTADALSDAFRAFDADAALGVAVLTGADGQFCAGADLKAVATGGGNRLEDLPLPVPSILTRDEIARAGLDERKAAIFEQLIKDDGVAPPLRDRLPQRGRAGDAPMGPTRMQLGKPVIAAVEGHAVAGGLELAIWCDLRVAAESAVFGVYCRRWGVPLIDGGTVRLPRLIGHARAMDMILTGRGIGAREASLWGLANRVVPDGEALPSAVALGHELARLPQTCLRSDRLSALGQWSLNERQALAAEFALGLATLASGEAVAGAARFSSGAGRGGTAA